MSAKRKLRRLAARKDDPKTPAPKQDQTDRLRSES